MQYDLQSLGIALTVGGRSNSQPLVAEKVTFHKNPLSVKIDLVSLRIYTGFKVCFIYNSSDTASHRQCLLMHARPYFLNYNLLRAGQPSKETLPFDLHGCLSRANASDQLINLCYWKLA